VIGGVPARRAKGPNPFVDEDPLRPAAGQMVGPHTAKFDELGQSIPLHVSSMVVAACFGVPNMGERRCVYPETEIERRPVAGAPFE